VVVKSWLLQYQHVPWQRGVHDCVLFIQKYTDEVWNEPYAYAEDYPFHDYKTAYKAFRKICKDHGVSTFEEVLDQHYYRVDLPVEGGIVAKPDSEGLTGYTYGICHEGFGFFVDSDGLVVYELNPLTDMYWSIK
jgi:hypothetical protein